MELWTRAGNGSGWKPWANTQSALASLLDARPEEVLLLSDAPDREREQLVSVLRLVRRLGGETLRVIVASPYPSLEWIEPLRPFGISQIWAVDRRRNGHARTVEEATRIEERMCPALHARTEKGVTLAVCGRVKDRMVLARHHLERWCLSNREACPYCGR